MSESGLRSNVDEKLGHRVSRTGGNTESARTMAITDIECLIGTKDQ